MISPPPAAAGATPPSRLLLVVVAALPVAQALIFVAQAPRNDQIGMDFRLTYTIAAAWRLGLDAYDDAVLKAVWSSHGDPRWTPPGLPQTPNVYPLTIAPVLAPLTFLPYRAALGVWLLLGGLALAAMLAGVVHGMGLSAWAVVLVAILTLGFPVRYGLSFGNLAVLTSGLTLWAIASRNRPAVSGLVLGFALLKYSLCGGIALVFAWQRRWRLLAVAAAVQLLLGVVATARHPGSDPLGWVRAMMNNGMTSMQPGAINHPAGLAHSALHLELASLLYRLQPGCEAVAPALVALLIVAAAVKLVRDRAPGDARHDRTTDIRPVHVVVLGVTLLAFYHRVYDLPVVLYPMACLLARRPWRGGAPLMAIAGVVIASLPGATANGGGPSTDWLISAVVQPAAIWGLLVIVSAALFMRPGRV